MSDARVPVIEIAELTKIYDAHSGAAAVRALDGVSLRIAMGESVALIGPSGSGKSTLMHILGCLDRPTSGQYFLDGKDVSRMSKDELAAVRNRKIGFVFQGFNLLSRTTALDNVELPLLYNGGSRMKKAERHRRAMERTLVGGVHLVRCCSQRPHSERESHRLCARGVESASGSAARALLGFSASRAGSAAWRHSDQGSRAAGGVARRCG